MTAFYDDPKFQQAAMEATRRANYSGRKQRIYRAYGSYCVRPADVEWGGEHVSYVEPDTALTHTKPVDVAWVDDNDGRGPVKLSNSIRCF